MSSLNALAGARVFVTGHTGFKGAWLTTLLHTLGAEVHGFASSVRERGAYHDLGVAEFVEEVVGDVRDRSTLAAAIAHSEPRLVFHLAAQPLVRESWADPVTTYETNVIGTVNAVHAALSTASIDGVVVATTDKVYENNELGRRFVETDRLGGNDPYGASKAAAEVALGPYRRASTMGLRGAPVVAVRAGNVIGGGDWSQDRLLPDIARALEASTQVVLRRPNAVRPWQHVLDCLHGYLLVAAAMLEQRPLSSAYNFAGDDATASVLDVARMAARSWGAPDDVIGIQRCEDDSESELLSLDSGLARRDLGWRPIWSLETSIAETVRFYRDPSIGKQQIADYLGAVRVTR